MRCRDAVRRAMIDVADWPLPALAHRPGVNARPAADAPLYAIAARAPDVTVPEAWRDNAPYLFGFRLYAATFFWEAHEVWERVWMRARPNSRERALLQGLIQLTNAGLKAALGHDNAARRLAGLAAAHFTDAGAGSSAAFMGLDPVACAATASSTQAMLELHYNS